MSRQSRRWPVEPSPRRQRREVEEPSPGPGAKKAQKKQRPIGPGPRWRIRQRHTDARGAWAGLGLTGFGLACVVGAVLLWAATPGPDDQDVGGFLFLLCLGIGFGWSGAALAWSSRRGLRKRAVRIWLDGRDLRWREHGRLEDAGRVARSDVAEVGLSLGGYRVEVRTVDGVEHVVTDLGTPSQRLALAMALGNAVEPGDNKVAPLLPPVLPVRWACEPGPRGDVSVLWRRPLPGYRWAVLMLALVAAAAVTGFFLVAPGALLTPVVLLWFLAVGGLCQWVGSAFRPVYPGLRVRAGELEIVEVEVRKPFGPIAVWPRRVVALGLDRHPRTGWVRLHALLENEESLTIMRGRRNVRRFARWLAKRAGIPLYEDR